MDNSKAGTTIVAITGASGALYGMRLITELLKSGESVDLVVSSSGSILLTEELGFKAELEDPETYLDFIKEKWGLEPKGTLTLYDVDNIAAPIASGSTLRRAMIICPCSMGTLSRVASGDSSNLIERAADCVLKEGGRLIVVPRETPFNIIHLENMLRLARAGALILPAMPAFYNSPKTVDDMVDFIVGKILDSLSRENELYRRWPGPVVPEKQD